WEHPKPVEEGEEYEVEITEVGTKGDGIARVENFVIFVPGTERGEKCKIKIKMVKPKFAIAEKVGESKGKEAPKKKKEIKKKLKEVEESEDEFMEVGGIDEDK
ncbi:MAG: TRAM domain-containing protein, partial [Candidatus Aenigmarchaeota archaeon]|nr:TRAM domain-containing protein [Candidatus Aenigmarchaeota archaeon]